MASNDSRAKTPAQPKRVGLFGLVCLVISAMLGGGVYNLPQSVAQGASAVAVLFAWIVTGLGTLCLANVFRILSIEKPELKNGIYSYAEKGFGRFMGFLVAYGYWICNCFAMVVYAILLPSTLDLFFPGVFGDGTNWASIGLSSGITWLMFVLACRGAQSTAIINAIGTIGKVVPIVLFILLMGSCFSGDFFAQHALGSQGAATLERAQFFDQVGSTMMITLFLFIGIEGAVVVSGEAVNAKAVSRATMIGFTVTLVLYVLVSIVPYGSFTQDEIGAMANPSMAALLASHFGLWGAVLVNVGIVISVLSAWLVWTVMLGQMPFYAAKDQVFPQVFCKENRVGAPVPSLLATTLVVQGLIVLAHFVQGNAWQAMVNITAVMAMPCYLVCSLYLFKLALHGPWSSCVRRSTGLAFGLAATLFSCYLIYEANIELLVVACTIFVIGFPIYLWARRKEQVFTKSEACLAVIIVIAAIVGICSMVGLI